MRQLKKTIVAGSMALLIAAASICVPHKSVLAARTITIDGDPSEWDGITMYDSSDSKISKWSVAKDDEYVYFYVQQNGGNQYGQPITDTNFTIKYDDGTSDGIRFSYNMGSIKNGTYSDIEGVGDADKASEPSQEKDKYETEFRIPQTFFCGKDYTLEYCGTKVESGDITDLSSKDEEVKKDDVYSGITIDGNFSDWNAVSKNDVSQNSESGNGLSKAAAVFDGDYIYIYMKEKSENASDGAAGSSGSYASGKYEIKTDTDRRTVLDIKLVNGKCEVSVSDYVKNQMGGNSITAEYSNRQYEIAVPVSAVKQYNESLSFGYYLSSSPLVSNIVNIDKNSSHGAINNRFSGIAYDGSFGDWDDYAHTIIEYSTQGGVGDDSEAALYASDGYIYGHVKSFLHKTTDGRNEFSPFTLRANSNDKTSISFRFVTVDSDGNIDWNPKITNLSEGNHEFTLVDIGSWTTYKNVSDEGFIDYGKITISAGSTCDEMEYEVDMKKLAKKFDIEINEMKVVEAKYINIGDEWVTYAGTSTGPVAGVAISCLTVAGVLLYRKRKVNNVVKTA